MRIIYLYLLIINALGFMLMRIDKYKAQNHLWRIPEAVLLIVAAIGGSLGTFAAMEIYHHKIRHWEVSIGVPVMLVLHLLSFIDLRNLGVLYHLFR